MRAGDHGDVIFEWKWAQKHCTVNTDVFCIWWLWNLGETHIFASCFVMMLEKHWQAPKKFKAQSHKTLAGTKKKQTPSIYSGLWIPIDWKAFFFLAFFCGCLPMFCEIVLCFLFPFLVPVQVWWACFMLKRKEHIYSVLCSFHSKITSPWSPKDITGNSRKVVLRQVAVPIKSS